MATTTTGTATVDNMFQGMVDVPDFTKYTLGRGVIDFTNLKQFNMYEKGYPFLIVVKIPEMIKKLAEVGNDQYKLLCQNFIHVLEYDFRNLDGINNMSAETQEITNGNQKLDVITKVNWEANSKYSMKFQERKGSLFARFMELYLRGIKDPTTQAKRYNGLLQPRKAQSVIEDGYENEIFEFLYFVTDNTVRYIEKAFFLTGCQFTECQLDQYNQEKGQIEWQDVNLSFNGYAITNPLVTQKAQAMLDWLNSENRLIVEQMKFAYKSLSDMPAPDALPGPQVSMSAITYKK